MKKTKKATANSKTFSSKVENVAVNRKLLLLFVIIFAGVGSALLLLTRAAVPTANIEPESKTVTSPAITGTDSAASGGKYVQFKAATTGSGTSSNFRTSGGKIIAPDGSNFIPNGANVGTQGQFEWWGDALGQSASAQQWGWTAIRLTLYVDDPFAPAGTAMSRGQQIINEYTAKHIVVIVGDWSCFSKSGTTTPSLCAPELAWFSTLAAANKSNPYVWMNCFNEPHASDAAWATLENSCTDTIRAAGNTAPMVADVQGAGADQPNWSGASTVTYNASMGPAVLAHDPLHNVLFSQHNYAGYCSNASEATYVDNMHAAGLSMVQGEFGFTDDSTSTAGDYTTNYNCALANFAVDPGKNVGLIGWHGTMGDHYALRSNSQPFYGTSALTDFGSRLWAVTH